MRTAVRDMVGGARRRPARVSCAIVGATLSAVAGLATIGWSPSSAEAAATASGVSCAPPVHWQSTTARAVVGVPSDFQLTSFDGTKLRVHWFPDLTAGTPVHPTVLMGPGWGQSGDTDISQAGIQGALSIGQLRAGGFNVLTWDPRGFGKSGGRAEVDSPKYEGRDVSAIINWVAQQRGVELDRAGVPRVGMVGESYGGGIQFAAAAHDCRIDAIAPTIAWNSLGTSLDKNKTPKAGWSNILQQVAATATLDPEIEAADRQMNRTGAIGAKATAFFVSRGPAQYLSAVKVPTLILQGTVDDLFTLDEGIANDRALQHQGTPVAMAWFCGGHGVCLTNPGSALQVGPLSLAWMQHYVAKDTSIPVLKGFAFVDQQGTAYASAQFPPSAGAPLLATGSGTLTLKAQGGSGPPTVAPDAQAANAVDAVAYAVTPAPAANAVNVNIPIPRDAVIVGAPSVSLEYSGTVPPGTRPTRVFAQLVDPATGIVVNNQVTPIPVILDGKAHRLVLPLETISYTAQAGDSLELQLAATTVAYVTPRLGGSVDFSGVKVALPTVHGLTVLQQG